MKINNYTKYNARNIQAQKILEYILSMGFFTTEKTEKKVKKSGLELAFEDIEKGRVHRLITPKNRKEPANKKPSDFFGTLTKQEGKKFQAYVNQSREEWNRNIF